MTRVSRFALTTKTTAAAIAAAAGLPIPRTRPAGGILLAIILVPLLTYCFLIYSTTNSDRMTTVAFKRRYDFTSPEEKLWTPLRQNPNGATGAMNDVIERTRLVRQQCELAPRLDDVTSDVWSTELFLRSLINDRRNGIAYCAVPKVASSTIKTALAVATERLPATDLRHLESIPVHDRKFMLRLGLRSAYSLARSSSKRLLSNATSFSMSNNALKKFLNRTVRRQRKLIVVRHPFDRLVSAYCDKFAGARNRWTDYFHRKYGRRIVERYRDSVSQPEVMKQNGDDVGHDVTFPEFVQFVTDESIEPAFRLNPHWAPQTELCRPCSVRYDFVVRIENFESEMVAIWNLLYPGRFRSSSFESNSSEANQSSFRRTWQDVEPLRLLSVRRNSADRTRGKLTAAGTNVTSDRSTIVGYQLLSTVNRDGFSDRRNVTPTSAQITNGSVLDHYLGLLTRDQLCRLVEVYRMDFEVFGYTPGNVNCIELHRK